MSRHQPWVNLDTESALLTIPKNASSALRKALKIHLTTPQAMNFPNRYALIRHPMERMKSAFAFFHENLIVRAKRDATFSHPTLQNVKAEHVIDWPTFVEHTFQFSNIHWDLQTSLPGTEIVTEWIAFDVLSLDVFENESYKDNLDWKILENHTDYRISDLVDKYEPDWDIYTSAIRYGMTRLNIRTSD